MPDRNPLSPLLDSLEDLTNIPQNILDATKNLGGSAIGAVVGIGTNATRSGIELGQNVLAFPLALAKDLGNIALNLLPALGDRNTKD